MLTYKTNREISTTTTLNDIPAGTVFEGTVVSKSGRYYNGVFLRLYTEQYGNGDSSNVFAVGLTVTDGRSIKLKNVPVQFFGCRTVLNYRELKNPIISESE